jgi:hypothetical protein
MIFVFSFSASLQFTPWTELTIHIPRGEPLLKSWVQRLSNSEVLHFVIRYSLFDIRF